MTGLNYYPYGMVMRSWSDGTYTARRNGYQGEYSETDESGLQNFELRTYDPVVGRWMSPDPYNQYHSPYVGMGDRPHFMVDPDGGLAGGGRFFAKVGGAYRNIAGAMSNLPARASASILTRPGAMFISSTVRNIAVTQSDNTNLAKQGNYLNAPGREFSVYQQFQYQKAGIWNVSESGRTTWIPDTYAGHVVNVDDFSEMAAGSPFRNSKGLSDLISKLKNQNRIWVTIAEAAEIFDITLDFQMNSDQVKKQISDFIQDLTKVAVDPRGVIDPNATKKASGQAHDKPYISIKSMGQDSITTIKKDGSVTKKVKLYSPMADSVDYTRDGE